VRQQPQGAARHSIYAGAPCCNCIARQPLEGRLAGVEATQRALATQLGGVERRLSLATSQTTLALRKIEHVVARMEAS
jgi:hypothetical protein